ncbi:MAG: VOC family protein [Gammaproteobacteria bacterium]|jgi:uncharacterized glyoxalase superfamily protein PhnB
MNAQATNPIPEGMHTVTPHLICADAAGAIEFYKTAFAAEELSRLPGADGRIMHAALRIGDSVMMMTEEFPEWNNLGPLALKGSPVTIHLYVTEVNDFFERAVRAGARVIMPIEDMFWGDRYGVIEDPFGHRWSIATHVRDVTASEMREAMKQMAANCPETTE